MRYDASGMEHQFSAAAESLTLCRDDNRFLEVLQPHVCPLEFLHALFEQIELTCFDRCCHLIEVCSRAEVRAGIADHHGFECLAALDLFGSGEHQLRGRHGVGVGLGTQREERYTVAEIAECRV